MPTTSRRWNHNIHYHGVIFREIPKGAWTALDVGCGNGLLTRELQRVVPEVVGIDADERVLDQARRDCGDVDWVPGDFLAHDFGRRFDMVASVAVLHHIPDLRAGLRRLAVLTAPGGVWRSSVWHGRRDSGTD
ncbi:class I SAM-dependent methyltransferase [Arachnia propionica]|uniref:class I SAM-dependent methyltransferase n=1 Tax=Arachnia propionica TaxID=1750 RepID=UPI003C702B7C